MELLELRFQLHELAGDSVDVGVQVSVLAVLFVELLLVALPLSGAADLRVSPAQASATIRKTETRCGRWGSAGYLTFVFFFKPLSAAFMQK